MQPLSTEFEKNGWKFRQVKRSGQIAIFEKTKKGPTHVIRSIEVVRIKKNEAWECHGAMQPAKETYPSSESWGRDGFTTRSPETAEELFAGLIEADFEKALDSY